jgi:hypothetical protein
MSFEQKKKNSNNNKKLQPHHPHDFLTVNYNYFNALRSFGSSPTTIKPWLLISNCYYIQQEVSV